MEKFNKEKFIQGLSDIKDVVAWSKDIIGIFNLRKVIIYALIAGLFSGYFYWRGISNKPINVGSDIIAYDKEFTIKLDKDEINKLGDYPAIKKPKNSALLKYYNWREDIYGGTIKVEDIEQLKNKVKPYGWQSKIVGTMGIGISLNDISGECGIGYRYAKLWSIRTEIMATNKGFYPISLSYKPDWIFSNTSINVSGGKAWENGLNRFFFGCNTEF